MNIATGNSSTINRLAANRLRHFSPPRQQALIETGPADTFIFSGAQAKPGPGLSTLKKLGLGLALTAAVGGAFVAGIQMSQPEEPTFENRMEDWGRKIDRGLEDFEIDLRRGAEDFETGFKRGYEDAQSPDSKERERRRESEDIQREWKRKTEDFTRDAGRKWNDFWDKLSD
ncbi:MAG: hypothetical protein WC314_21770 [Vulcanimicrobiota bacterium]